MTFDLSVISCCLSINIMDMFSSLSSSRQRSVARRLYVMVNCNQGIHTEQWAKELR